MAWLEERTGIFSFARYASRADDADAQRKLTLRALKILAHETGHMLGIEKTRGSLAEHAGFARFSHPFHTPNR
jgi:predicted Zn-dependent protease